jgi:serine phosphatase RsbU (regulator of sigma subunit)
MPLYIYRKQAEPLKNQTGEVIEPILQEGLYFVYEIKPDKMPVGYFDEHARYFSNHTLQMMATDRVYLFTDGFPDQFGGEKEKKYKRTRLLSFLLSIQRLSLVDQRQTIAQEFNAWKGNIEQIDDVSVLAVEI